MHLALRPVALAVALTGAGAGLVVVGGTARCLRGSAHRPRDLDVVVAARDVPRLVEALRDLGVDAGAACILRSGCSRFATSYGPLDVFLGPPPVASPLDVAGVQLVVAA